MKLEAAINRSPNVTRGRVFAENTVFSRLHGLRRLFSPTPSFVSHRRNLASLNLIVRSMTDVSAVPEASPLTRWRQLLAPVIVTVALVVWTVLVSPHSKYGDNWAIWAAVLAFPIALIWHIVNFIMRRGHRRSAASVAVCHLVILAPIWFWSLTGSLAAVSGFKSRTAPQ